MIQWELEWEMVILRGIRLSEKLLGRAGRFSEPALRGRTATDAGTSADAQKTPRGVD